MSYVTQPLARQSVLVKPNLHPPQCAHHKYRLRLHWAHWVGGSRHMCHFFGPLHHSWYTSCAPLWSWPSVGTATAVQQQSLEAEISKSLLLPCKSKALPCPLDVPRPLRPLSFQVSPRSIMPRLTLENLQGCKTKYHQDYISRTWNWGSLRINHNRISSQTPITWNVPHVQCEALMR